MEEKKSNGLSIAALVCGILGIIGTFIPIVCFFTFVLAILGNVFGILGRKKCASKGMGTAGLVLGIIGTAFGLIGVICYGCAVCAVCSAGGLGALAY